MRRQNGSIRLLLLGLGLILAGLFYAGWDWLPRWGRTLEKALRGLLP